MHKIMYLLVSIPQTLAGFNDVDSFCDVVDALEEQGIEKHMDVCRLSPLAIEDSVHEHV